MKRIKEKAPPKGGVFFHHGTFVGERSHELLWELL